MKTEKVGRIINGKPAHVYPVEAIEEAVRELEAGKTSMQDVMVKFGIARSNTIKRWIKTYGRAESFPGIRIRLPEPQKRQIVIEVESGKLSWLPLAQYTSAKGEMAFSRTFTGIKLLMDAGVAFFFFLWTVHPTNV